MADTPAPPGFRSQLWDLDAPDQPALTGDALTAHLRDLFRNPKAIGLKLTMTFVGDNKRELKRQLAKSGLLTKSISKRARIRMKLALKYGGFFK